MLRWFTALIVLLSSTSGVHADNLQVGIQHYSLGRYQEAITTLEREKGQTQESSKLGQIELYIGLSHAVLGETALAEQALARALGHDPDLSLHPKRFKKELIDLLRRVRARLKPPPEPQPVPTYNPKPKPQPVPTYNPRPEPKPEPVVEPPPAKDSFWKRRRIWTWVALGGAAACLAASIGVYYSAEARISDEYEPLLDEWRQIPDHQKLTSGKPHPVYQKVVAKAHELSDELPGRARTSNILGAVAGGLAATAVVLFIFEGRPTESRDTARLSPTLGVVNGATLSVPF